MLRLLQHLLTTYGYLAVAVGVLIESMGVPIPSETLLLLGAAYAGAGNLNIWGVISAAALGAIIGDSIGYASGKHGGRALLERYGKVLHLNTQHLERAEVFFSRYGDKTVFFGRFIAILRTFSAFLAGVYRMPYHLVGFSRMYLGVDNLSDVLAGYAAGFAWLVITITGVETIIRRRHEL